MLQRESSALFLKIGQVGITYSVGILIEIWHSGEVRICAYSRAILEGSRIAIHLAAGCSGIDFLLNLQ